MIYISCSKEEFKNIVDILSRRDVRCPLYGYSCPDDVKCCICIKANIKRINTDITPDTPNYSTEAENTAFLQGFNVAVKKMRGEMV